MADIDYACKTDVWGITTTRIQYTAFISLLLLIVVIIIIITYCYYYFLSSRRHRLARGSSSHAKPRGRATGDLAKWFSGRTWARSNMYRADCFPRRRVVVKVARFYKNKMESGRVSVVNPDGWPDADVVVAKKFAVGTTTKTFSE